MLDNIKSLYFLQFVFSNITEKLKLKLIKYNKNFQNKLNISLINYEIFSERYIIFETEKKGKEYNCYYDILLFEGEYLNKKRNGKGREYDAYRQIIFEGEYLNGKRHGKGKEYSDNGTLIYDGEYLNGERNGKGKEYNENGQVEFEGEFLKGKKWSGKGYYKNFNVANYELKDGKGIIKGCEYINGEKNGEGEEYNFNYKLVFEGEYLNGKWWTGTGYDENENIAFEIKGGKRFIKEYNNYGGLIS